MIIAAYDPGKDNFANSFVDVSLRGQKVKYELLHSCMIQHTVQDLTGDLTAQIKAFIREINVGVRKFKPNSMIAERFMNRGMMKGASGEIVSIMIGRMTALNVHMTVIPSASWKNAFNRVQSLDHLYENVPFVPHVVDSLCIGLYHGCKQLNVKPYEFLSSDKEYSTLVRNMEKLHARASKEEQSRGRRG